MFSSAQYDPRGSLPSVWPNVAQFNEAAHNLSGALDPELGIGPRCTDHTAIFNANAVAPEQLSLTLMRSVLQASGRSKANVTTQLHKQLAILDICHSGPPDG